MIFIHGTDISQNELVVLENHVVYSLSKEKTAARFYIMQCTQSGYEKVISFPLKDAIQRFSSHLSLFLSHVEKDGNTCRMHIIAVFLVG